MTWCGSTEVDRHLRACHLVSGAGAEALKLVDEAIPPSHLYADAAICEQTPYDTNGAPDLSGVPIAGNDFKTGWVRGLRPARGLEPHARNR
jgi:hypothetical protein